MARCSLQFLASVILIGMAGCYAPPAENDLVGKPETTVRSRLGQPDREFDGHYGAPTIDFTGRFKGEVKTAVFKKPGGEIYVSFERRDEKWVAICNSWLPDGWSF